MGLWDDIVRRGTTGEIRKEDMKTAFWEDKFKGALPLDIINILHDIHDFDGFEQFKPAEVLKEVGDVKVVLDDKYENKVSVSREELIEASNSYKEEKQQLETLRDEMRTDLQEGRPIDGGLLEEITCRIQKLDKLIEDLETIIGPLKPGEKYSFRVSRLGYYTRRPTPEIHLMMGVLKDDPILTGIVFVHEMMHAYFDKHNPEVEHPSCKSIEEPIAEYGMLCFMEMFERLHPKYSGILKQAQDLVEGKKYSLGVCHYGFGAFLFSDRSGFGSDWVSLFHSCCPAIEMNSVEVKSYESMISPVRYPRFERACAVRLYDLLKPVRYCFKGKITYYAATRSVSSDRIFANDRSGIGSDPEFKKDYLSYVRRHPTEILLTFIYNDGSSFPGVKGDASIEKGEAVNRPPRINIKNNLLAEYIRKFSPKNHEKREFLFYEKSPSDGSNPAEWIAREI